MADIPASRHDSKPTPITRDLVNILVIAAGLFAIVFIGATITQSFANPSVWVTAAAYGVPAGLIWLAYRWLVDHI
jgi:hypothetical protein